MKTCHKKYLVIVLFIVFNTCFLFLSGCVQAPLLANSQKIKVNPAVQEKMSVLYLKLSGIRPKTIKKIYPNIQKTGRKADSEKAAAPYISPGMIQTTVKNLSFGSYIFGIYQPGISQNGINEAINEAIINASFQYNFPLPFLLAVIRVESDFNVNAVSSKGAVGLMQIMPQTAKELGINPYDPVMNVLGGAKYLRYCLNKFHDKPVFALACYNAGPGSVKTTSAFDGKKYEAIPDYNATLHYILIVHKYYSLYNKLLN